MKRSICVLATMAMGAAAWAQQAPQAQPAAGVPAEPPVNPAWNTAQLMQRNGGSLMRASMAMPPEAPKARLSGISFYVVPEPQPKVLRKHDLVTIIIREESEMSSEGNTDLKKDMNFDAKIQEWFRLRPELMKIEGGGAPDQPGAAFGASRDFKGEATVDRTDSFITRIQAEVIDVKPNETFAIQARKRIKHDEEETEYILTGTCRAGDLTADNTILSWQVHDLVVETKHKGAVRDSTKRGLVPGLLDFVNPF